MQTLSELFVDASASRSQDHIERVLLHLFTWPRTTTLRDLDRACLTVPQDILNLDAAATVANMDIELHATGRRESVTLLKILAAYRTSLMMLTKADNVLVYDNGVLAVRVRLNETQTGRSASVDVAQVRMAFRKMLSWGPFNIAFLGGLLVALGVGMILSFSRM